MRYAQLMTSVINRIIGIYETNAKTKSRERAVLLENMAWLSEAILIGGTIAYAFCAVLHLMIPIYGYFWQHEYKALFPLYIPFVDEKTACGFVILVSIQTIEIFIAAVASGYSDFLFMMITVNVWIFSSIFKDNVSELNGILCRKKRNFPFARRNLQHICELYYDIWV